MDRDDEAFALLKVGNDFDIAGKIHNWKVRFQIWINTSIMFYKQRAIGNID